MIHFFVCKNYWTQQGEIIIHGNNLPQAELDSLNATFNAKSETMDKISKSYLNAKPETIPFAYEWTIENFSFNQKANSAKNNNGGSSLMSANFSPVKGKHLEFCLDMRLNNNNENKDSKEYMSLYLWLRACPTSCALVNYRLSILGRDGTKACTQSKSLLACNLELKLIAFLL